MTQADKLRMNLGRILQISRRLGLDSMTETKLKRLQKRHQNRVYKINCDSQGTTPSRTYQMIGQAIETSLKYFEVLRYQASQRQRQRQAWR